MRKLRIAFLSCGGLVHIRAYLRYFAARGHEVCWLAYDRPMGEHGVLTYDVSWGASGKDNRSKWKYLLSAWSARKLLRAVQPDILHGHYATSAGSIALLSGFRPFCLTVHGSDLINSMKSPLWRPALKRIFKRAAFVNVVSDQLAEHAMTLGVDKDRCLTATLGVDTKLFAYQEPATEPSPIRLLCTRTLAPVYDPLTIVRAGAVLRDRGVPFSLTFAAGGPLEPEVRDEVRRHRLDEQVSFWGGYANDELPSLLNGHDIFVSASMWDGTSICLLEAMSSGIFPVVSRIRSNEAWLEDGRTALMFDVHKPESLADAVVRAIGDESLRRRAVRANRAIVEARADRDANMARLEAHYYRYVDVSG